MKLSSEFIRLPLRFDVSRLTGEVNQFADSLWRPHPQGYPGNTALPLISAHGDPANDQTKGPMRPTAYLEACPYVRQVLASFGSAIGRTRLMRIDGNGEAHAHVDTNYYWLQRVRIHVPIITDPAVQFVCGSRSIHMPAGEAWVFDTWRTHNVINPNPTRRIHLVADSLGSAAFWDLVERTSEEPKLVPFEPGRAPDLHLETVNQPVVMSPYEQESLLSLLFAELPDAQLSHDLRAELTRFVRDWRVLWSEYGESQEGWRPFTALRDQLHQILQRFEGRIALPNGTDAAEIVRQMLVRPSINPELADLAHVAGPARRIERPIFIVSSPRAGSSMLFETLLQSPSVFTIGGESHSIIEGVPRLAPQQRRFESNRLTADDADVATAKTIEERFCTRLHDREQRPASGVVRMLEKTPKNSLRIPFFDAIFPDAYFIYLYRDPRATMSSMLDAWRSGRFVTYPGLPEWHGLPWSLVLTPGWRDLIGKPQPEIVAHQWASATTTLLDDLEALSPDRWCVAGYREIVEDPQKEVKRLCEFVGIEWDRELKAPLPLSRHTLTPPDPDKVKRNGPELDPVMHLTKDVTERARDLFATPPAQRKRKPRAVAAKERLASAAVATSVPPPTASDPATPAPVPPNFTSVFTASFPSILHRL
ncbi:MAG: sulfotransferase, partial [Thermoanaerobaculia bacterium]